MIPDYISTDYIKLNVIIKSNNKDISLLNRSWNDTGH